MYTSILTAIIISAYTIFWIRTLRTSKYIRDKWDKDNFIVERILRSIVMSIPCVFLFMIVLFAEKNNFYSENSSTIIASENAKRFVHLHQVEYEVILCKEVENNESPVRYCYITKPDNDILSIICDALPEENDCFLDRRVIQQ